MGDSKKISKRGTADAIVGYYEVAVEAVPCFPRMAEHAIAISPMIPAAKKVKFIALTNTAGCAGVGVADASPL
jgi:hypothetical protein